MLINLQLKRHHSAEPVDTNSEPHKTPKSVSPALEPVKSENEFANPPSKLENASSTPVNSTVKSSNETPETVGSRMKRQRSSISGPGNDSIEKPLGNDAAMNAALGEILGTSKQTMDNQKLDNNKEFGGPLTKPKIEAIDDEEL